MKKTTKIIASAVAAIAMFFSINANAQDSRNLGIGLTVGIPTSDAYGVALGGDIRYQFDVSKQLSIPITAGFTNWMGKEIGNTGVDFPDYSYIPLKAGLKYFFSDTGSGLYGLAEAGAAFSTGSNSGTNFVFSPALGYAWSNGLDLGVKYEGVSANSNTSGFVGLRLAYGFKL